MSNPATAAAPCRRVPMTLGQRRVAYCKHFVAAYWHLFLCWLPTLLVLVCAMFHKADYQALPGVAGPAVWSQCMATCAVWLVTVAWRTVSSTPLVLAVFIVNLVVLLIRAKVLHDEHHGHGHGHAPTGMFAKAWAKVKPVLPWTPTFVAVVVGLLGHSYYPAIFASQDMFCLPLAVAVMNGSLIWWVGIKFGGHH